MQRFPEGLIRRIYSFPRPVILNLQIAGYRLAPWEGSGMDNRQAAGTCVQASTLPSVLGEE